MRVRVTTSGSGFCGFCGSFSQTVDIAYFSRFWACGSLVVFACGFVVLWIACGFWIARSALRVRSGKATRSGINQGEMRLRTRRALRVVLNVCKAVRRDVAPIVCVRRKGGVHVVCHVKIPSPAMVGGCGAMVGATC